MINVPPYGTKEYSDYQVDQRLEQEHYDKQVALQREHELKLKEMELEITKAEVSFAASTRLLLTVPLSLIYAPVLAICIILKRNPGPILAILSVAKYRPEEKPE